ncbi:ATP-grasp domain-containing protein [Algoriphagus formosus]|uniref:ATP-grasp domain-containing protein n=2 Tax=Algoriphagus formosus TaxID=2007308 RepID=UPI003F72D344
MMKKKIGIVSYVSTGAYDANTIDEDQILSKTLSELGFDNEIMPWSDQKVDWAQYDALLIKSVWDYFDYYPEFLQWMDRMESLKIPVFNDLKTIRWNSSKTYLLEMDKKGFPVIAGVLLDKGSTFDPKAVLEGLAVKEFVIKPLVSGGAKNTFRLDLEKAIAQQDQIQGLLETEAFLAQPFVREVAEVGEYSLIFFDGKFSHAVLKTPKKEDFRVQHYFGGTIQEIDPDVAMLESATSFVKNFASESLYARVDGVMRDGVFYLMELELIEPYLFLGLSEKAMPNYQAAIRSKLA